MSNILGKALPPMELGLLRKDDFIFLHLFDELFIEGNTNLADNVNGSSEDGDNGNGGGLW